MKMKDLMHEKVITCNPDTSLKIVNDMMVRHGFRQIPVVDGDEKPLGVITSHDVRNVLILYRSKHKEDISDIQILSFIKVEKLLKKEVLTLPPDASISTAAGMLVKDKYGCIIIIENGKIAGIVTALDVLKFVAESMQEVDLNESKVSIEDKEEKK